jgi:hypothetical protein
MLGQPTDAPPDICSQKVHAVKSAMLKSNCATLETYKMNELAGDVETEPRFLLKVQLAIGKVCLLTAQHNLQKPKISTLRQFPKTDKMQKQLPPHILTREALPRFCNCSRMQVLNKTGFEKKKNEL